MAERPNFTPGPWWLRGKGTVCAGGERGPRIADMYVGNRAANARLIVAAPALYEALEELLTDMVIAQGNMRDAAKRDHRWEGCAEAIQPRIDAARAALAAARGGQP